MEKNTNKFVRKPNNFLGLILFTIIYFLVQNVIYPLLGILFWLFFTLIFGGIADALGILKIKEIQVVLTYLFYCICLVILSGVMCYLGYLYKDFLGKMNKIGLNTVMIVILIYFVFRAIFENKYSSIMFRLTNGRKYIFCILSHVSFVIGVFYSDKVKKILDKIKFKRK